jgi:hypothetical protein
MGNDRVRGWYRSLVGRYPRAFRERFGESMDQTFADLLREQSDGGQPLPGLVARTFAETGVGIVREHIASGGMRTLVRRPTAWLPMAVSLLALAFVLGYAAVFGVTAPSPQAHQDEGAPARIFQLLMVAQGLLIVTFAARWLPRAPRQATMIIAVQVLVAAVPIVTILLLER